MNSFCQNCKSDFYYDDNLNVRYFDTIADSRGFRVGGLFPICPNCGAECKREEVITWESSQITMKTVWVAMDLDCVLSGVCLVCENPFRKGSSECDYCKDKAKIERLLLR